MNPFKLSILRAVLLLLLSSIVIGEVGYSLLENPSEVFSSFCVSPILLNDTTAVFVYRGTADSMGLAGDWNGWRPQKMTFDSSCAVWYSVLTFPADARLDYKLVVDGSNWIIDPANPHTCKGGFGENSELAMPQYQPPEEIMPRSGVPCGKLVESILYSRSLQQQRTLYLYFPADRQSDGHDLPFVLFLDGQDFLQAGSAKIVLDNLIASGRIPPLIAVFDSPSDRLSEYAGTLTDALETFIDSELLPMVAVTAKISKNPAHRAVVGVSLSAVFASRFVQRHPDQFGCCGAFSPAYWYDNQRVFHEIRKSELGSIRFYIDRGLFEGDSIVWADSMVKVLEQKGVTLRRRIWPEGHSWGSWRAHLDEALVFFFADTK